MQTEIIYIARERALDIDILQSFLQIFVSPVVWYYKTHWSLVCLLACAELYTVSAIDQGLVVQITIKLIQD